MRITEIKEQPKGYKPAKREDADIICTHVGDSPVWEIRLPIGEKRRTVQAFARSLEGAERLGTTGLSVQLQNRLIKPAITAGLNPQQLQPFLERIEDWSSYEEAARDFIAAFGGREPADEVAAARKHLSKVKQAVEGGALSKADLKALLDAAEAEEV